MTSGDLTEEVQGIKQDVRRGLDLLGLTNSEHLTIQEFETYWQRASSVTEAMALIGLLPHLQVVTAGSRGGSFFLAGIHAFEFLVHVLYGLAEPDTTTRQIQVQALRALGTMLNKDGKIDSVGRQMDEKLTLMTVAATEACLNDQIGFHEGCRRGIDALSALAGRKLAYLISEDYMWRWRLWDNPHHHTPREDAERESRLLPVRQRLVNLAMETNSGMFTEWCIYPNILMPTVEAMVANVRFTIPDLPEGLPDDPWEMTRSELLSAYKADVRSRLTGSLGKEEHEMRGNLDLLELIRSAADIAHVNELMFSLPKPKEDED